MANPMLPRDKVHEWSDGIGENPTEHQPSIARLLKDQRRLTRFVEENAANMEGASASIAIYLIGVLARMFEMAGGKMRSATWDHVRSAESSVNTLAASLLPLDEGFLERARAVERSQPHMLDEALYALFVRAHTDDEQKLEATESFKVYLIMWVASEALNANWRPPSNFSGATTYTHDAVGEGEVA